jgi:hypothetical protein
VDKKKVQPGFSWGQVESATVEVDSGFVVFGVTESSDAAFNSHDIAVMPSATALVMQWVQ